MDLKYDESSPFPIDPDIGGFADNLDRVTDRVYNFPEEQEEILRDQIDHVESNLAEETPDEDRIKYIATLEAVLDLVEIGYVLDKNGDLKLYPPATDQYHDDPEKYKQIEREVLQKERQAQFQKESVRDFIKKMERRPQKANQNGSVERLVVNGDDLYADLAPLSSKDRDDIIDALDEVIQPYIQVAEKGNKDPHTGNDLMDIWRYFRYTWLTPYNTVPGRNINFLIRDAARPDDPVMGIASLASSMMNLTVRDNDIGWRIDALKAKLERKSRDLSWEVQLPKEERTENKKVRVETDTEFLETEAEYEKRKKEVCEKYREAIEEGIDRSISNVSYEDFIENSEDLTRSHFEEARSPVFEELQRFEGLARYVIQERPPITESPETDDEEYFDLSEWGLTEADLSRIWFKDTDPEDLDSWEQRCQTALFVRKRAQTLQKLLRDRAYVREHSDESDVEFIEMALDSKEGRRAIKTGLKEVKKRRVGAGMMNIMVCGAIPPYNEILGGKLVAMSLVGPKVINAYRDKYGGYESKIASSMKGEAVTKSNDLVLLDTTGLFEVGSAQYDRIRVPTDEGEIEFEEQGTTEGYGSVQFGGRTRKRLAQVTELEEGRQVVRGRFGEGIAPRMRKIRRGLENCGLDGELLKHESPRIVYTVELATNAREYLLGLTDDPNYVWDFEDVQAEQQRIYDHWKKRWVSKRIQKEEILDRVNAFNKREDLLLGNEIMNGDQHYQRELGEFE